MAKKKAAAAASASASSSTNDDATAHSSSSSSRTAELFTLMQSKNSQWYEKERAGIALLEGFQTALNACRDELTTASEDSSTTTTSAGANEPLMTAFTGLGGNSQMDPLLAEDLFAQVKELKHDFEELLQGMCDLHLKARQLVLAAAAAGSEGEEGDAASEAAGSLALAPIDYYQFIGHELAAYEAEYQHVEALLDMISFDITTDQLRTLVISWSTSPFLNPEQSHAFRKRHELATQQTSSK